MLENLVLDQQVKPNSAISDHVKIAHGEGTVLGALVPRRATKGPKQGPGALGRRQNEEACVVLGMRNKEQLVKSNHVLNQQKS